jgi:hypothetical protein
MTASSSNHTGALQWKTDYSAATGGFVGSGGLVACTSGLPAPALFGKNDVDATSTLTLGLISNTGFAAPLTIATCTFLGDPNDPPKISDFAVTIEDQVDVALNPITATIAITQITEIIP